MGKVKKFRSTVISIRQLTSLARMNYFKLYNRQKGIYTKPLSLDDRTKLLNALIKDISPFVADLGFEITVKPIYKSQAENKSVT